MANHSPRTSAQNTPLSFRCKPGDLVMIVRGKTECLLGRVGVVVCHTADAAEIMHPDDSDEVQKRDWVVDLHGGPNTFFRDGLVVATHRLACTDRSLMPIRADDIEAIESMEDLCAGVSQ